MNSKLRRRWIKEGVWRERESFESTFWIKQKTIEVSQLKIKKIQDVIESFLKIFFFTDQLIEQIGSTLK